MKGWICCGKQGVQTAQATDAELRTAVVRCAGHALSLELLASILRRNQSLSLHSLFNNPLYAQLWTGDIASQTGVLDALNVLLSQHLLQDSGKECYQLHAIVAQ